jgi:hypothetical protein
MEAINTKDRDVLVFLIVIPLIVICQTPAAKDKRATATLIVCTSMVNCLIRLDRTDYRELRYILQLRQLREKLLMQR